MGNLGLALLFRGDHLHDLRGAFTGIEPVRVFRNPGGGDQAGEIVPLIPAKVHDVFHVHKERESITIVKLKPHRTSILLVYRQNLMNRCSR